MTNKNNKNQVSFYDEQLENFHFEVNIFFIFYFKKIYIYI